MIPDHDRAPVFDPKRPIPEAHCGLCQRPCDYDDFNEVAGLYVCPACLEDMLDASALNTRAEVGMVGTSGGRP